jgi:hypothetical protein
VRRANGRGPRGTRNDLEALAWSMIGFSGRRLARQARPHGIELVTSDGQRRVFGSGDRARLSGPASELMLYLGGRRATAQVSLGGAPEAVAAIERADLRV